MMEVLDCDISHYTRYRGLFIFKFCSRLFFFVVFPFPLATLISVSIDGAHRTQLGTERWRLDIEMARETDMVREMYIYEDGGRWR
jgi:hypothetical protein